MASKKKKVKASKQPKRKKLLNPHQLDIYIHLDMGYPFSAQAMKEV